MMKWVILGISIGIGFVFLKLWLLRSPKKELGKQLFELAVNSVFWGFLIWKGSLLLLEPKLIVESPMSLLYFTGGTRGFILGILGIRVIKFQFHPYLLLRWLLFKSKCTKIDEINQ